jgi:hypothetical protein
MFFENNYIHYSSKLLINSIPNYKNIMTKFINGYIKLNKIIYVDNNLLVEDSIIYAKYYLYYKTKKCIYSDKIMEILNDVDYYLLEAI